MSTPVTIEPGRLSRALTLPVKRMGVNEYAVASRSRKDHVWYVKLDRDPVCECEDSWYRGTKRLVCMHELAARLADAAYRDDLDDPVLNTAGAMLLRRQRAREDLGVLRNARGEVVTGGAVKLMDVEDHYG